MCVSRCGAIFSGVFCLIQGIVWLGLCIVGLLAFKCNFQVNSKEVEIFLDIYFNNGQCEGATHSEIADILWDIIAPKEFAIGITDIDYTTIVPEIKWPTTIPASDRTQAILVIYVALTASWILTSMMLTIGASIESKGPAAAFFYVPWITNTFLICIMDVVATILYALDIPKTTNLLDFLRFIGLKLPDVGDHPELTEPQIYTAVPAIVMTVVCARAILLWLLNLILLLATILALKNNLENYRIQKNKPKEGEWRNVAKLWLTEPPPRKDSTESIPPQGGSNPWQMRPRELPPPARLYNNENNAIMKEMDPTFHDFLRAEDGGRSSFRENGPPTAELRNGLPWSYFSHRDDLKGPPKRNKNVLEPMPPVPPPDYTLKFPQYTRPVINRNENHRSSWSSKDGSTLGTPEPYIPAPDYERKRLPPRMVGRQTSQESSTSSQAPQPRYGSKQPPYIPQPDYNRRAPPNVMKPSMKQELQQMVAARGRTNPGYISTEDDGYREPHIPAPDYAKPRRVKARADELENKLWGNPTYNNPRGHNSSQVSGRARHYGYF